MVNRLKIVVLLSACILAFLAAPAAAEHQYYFEVPAMTIDAYPQQDGSMKIKYRIKFKNLSSDPLDIVDIGVPHDDYDLDAFSASIGGHALSSIRPSEYVKPGVEVPLSNRSIAKGKTSTFQIEFTMPKMIYYDDDDANYTSVVFGNTYFGSDFSTGSMKLTMNFHFPEGITGNETKWHREKPGSMKTVGGHIVFTWEIPEASPSSMYKFGIGFPTRYVNADAIQKYSLCADLILKCFTLIIFAIPIILPLGIIVLLIVWRVWAHRRRMKKYLPPALSIEGAGPKRGLTAPEAAIILELPPDRVLMTILFGLMKKQAVRVISEKPLKLDKVDPAPKKLRPYELQFMAAIMNDHTVSEKKLRKMFVALIKSVNRKLKGFSRKDTRVYYRHIMDVAWKKVEAAATPDLGEAFADRADWLLLNDDFGDKTKEVFQEREVVVMPRWWGHGWGHPIGDGATPAGPGGSISMPGADFAHSFTNSLTSFSNTVVDSVSSFTQSITKITNPPPVSTSSSSGGSSGGCACACACAGCACACAGGR